MVSDDAVESGDVTVLDAAGDESRMRIVQALVEHRSEQPRDPGLPFSALRDASGIRDSGRFNYHLDKLRDRFVEEENGEYRLTYAGRKLGIALVSGTYRSGISKGPTEFGTCPREDCGATLLARYEEGNVVVDCENDHRSFRTGLPPGAAVDRSMEELFGVVVRSIFSDLETVQEGICPYCYGTVDPEIAFDEFGSDSDYLFQASCTRCGTHINTSPGLCALTHPTVRAFLRDHGRSIHDSRPWEFDFLFDSGSRSIVAEDPLRTEIEIELAGDCLRATIDDSGRVVKTEELD